MTWTEEGHEGGGETGGKRESAANFPVTKWLWGIKSVNPT